MERARLPRRAIFAGAIHHARGMPTKARIMHMDQQKGRARLTGDVLLEDRPAEAAASAARRWLPILARYREPSAARGWLELGVTAAALTAVWAAMWWSLSVSYWLCLLLAIPGAGLVVRIFVIQHDCGHGAYFRHRALNDLLGRALGVVTLTPYDVWKRAHAIHHATSGNLNRRGVGDITTLTVREYQSRTLVQRMAYRLYRNPLVLFVIGPAYMFVLQHRLPIGFMRGGATPWLSAMGTNAMIGLAAAGLITLVGLWPFLLIQAPLTLLAASMGVWLFYVQHQFENTVWEKDGDWNVSDAALNGSSFYDLPAVLRWFTASIGVHHVHHLCSRIPFYRLQQVMEDHPDLGRVHRLTIAQSLKCVPLALWDEDRQRLVSFADVRGEGRMRA